MLGEISKLKLRNEPYKVTRQLTPTTYQLEHPETGKLKSRPVHVAQIARLRISIPLHERAVEELSPHTAGGSERDVVLAEDELWERLRVPGHVVFRFKDDEVFWLRVAEVLAVDLEGGTAELWYHLRSRRHSTKKWDEPLFLSPQHPEYFAERNPSLSYVKPKKEKLPGLRRRQGQVDKSDVEIVVPYFLCWKVQGRYRERFVQWQMVICVDKSVRARPVRSSLSLVSEREGGKAAQAALI